MNSILIASISDHAGGWQNDLRRGDLGGWEQTHSDLPDHHRHHATLPNYCGLHPPRLWLHDDPFQAIPVRARPSRLLRAQSTHAHGPIPFVSDLPSSLLTIICGWQPTMVHHSVTPPIPAGIVLLAFGPALIGISLSCHCPGSF